MSVDRARKLLMPPMVHHPACDKPAAKSFCKCGANVGCSTCGWGHGSHPCACKRTPTPTKENA